MKKFLVAIALVIIATMLMSVPAVGADNTEVSVDELIKWDVLGENLHYVGKATTTPPVQDGIINDGEYTYTYRYEDPIFMCDENYNKLPTNEYTNFASSYVDLCISYDDENVYIAIFDNQYYKDTNTLVGPTNLVPMVGIDLDNVVNLDNNFSNTYNGKGHHFQVTQRLGVVAGPTNLNYADASLPNTTKWILEDGQSYDRISLYGLASADGTGGYDTVYELKYSRDNLLAIFNGIYGTGYIESPDTVLFTYCMQQYCKDASNSTGPCTYARWIGKALTNVDKINLGTTMDFVPAVIVLGEEETEVSTEKTTEAPDTTAPETTEAPDTTAPETTEAPGTTAPETTETPATNAPETEAPDTEAPAEGGCGGYIGTMGIALVATLGVSAVIASKKKKED